MGIIYEDSLSIVQVVQGGQKSSIPLVLIHDGGGTIQSYQALGPIGRDVFAIANPRFDDGVPWEGGIPEMARTYAQIIKARVPSKTVLLGGWSFGGFLALEIASLMAHDDDLDVAGLILIDAPYPKVSTNRDMISAIHGDLPDLTGVKPRLRRKIHASIKHARQMLASYQLPQWQDALMPPTAKEIKSSFRASFDLRSSIDLRRSSFDIRSSIDKKRTSIEMMPPPYSAKGSSPPAAILLRASDSMRRGADHSNNTSLVDVFRGDPFLGWNEYVEPFIKAVWDVPGNHYSIFGPSNVNHITTSIAKACQNLCPEQPISFNDAKSEKFLVDCK